MNRITWSYLPSAPHTEQPLKDMRHTWVLFGMQNWTFGPYLAATHIGSLCQ
jgi:hypothetical protein